MIFKRLIIFTLFFCAKSNCLPDFLKRDQEATRAPLVQKTTTTRILGQIPSLTTLAAERIARQNPLPQNIDGDACIQSVQSFVKTMHDCLKGRFHDGVEVAIRSKNCTILAWFLRDEEKLPNT